MIDHPEEWTGPVPEETAPSRSRRVVRVLVRLIALLAGLALVVWMLVGVPPFSHLLLYCGLLGGLALAGARAGGDRGEKEE